jgi:antitoxin MazE
MRIKLKKIGNSKGITLSKSLLEQYQFEEEVEIVTLAGGLLVMPVKAKPREEWEKQFKATMLEGFPNQFDKEDWTW